MGLLVNYDYEDGKTSGKLNSTHSSSSASTNVTAGSNTNVPISVLNSNDDSEVGDVIGSETETQYTASSNTNVTKDDIINKAQKIQDKCRKNGLVKAEIEENILKVAGFTRTKFEKCTLQEQNEILECIDMSIDSYIELKKKYGVSQDVDSEKYIAERSKNLRSAKQYGLVRNGKEFNSMVGDVNARLGKDYNSLSDEDKYKRIESVYSSFNKDLSKKEEKALSKCKTDEQRDNVRAEFQRRRELAEQQRIMDFMAVNGAEGMPQAVLLGSGKRLDKNIEQGMSVLNTDARTTAANSVTNENLMSAVKTFNDRGEMPDEEVLGDAVHALVSEKSYEAAKQFEIDNAEYRRKVESGEIKAPYLTKKHLNKMTSAVGTGIMSNIHMTAEQKAEILNSWNDHVSELSEADQKEIKKFINDYINVHPELAKISQEIEKIIKTKYNKGVNKQNKANSVSTTGANDNADLSETSGNGTKKPIEQGTSSKKSKDDIGECSLQPLKPDLETIAYALSTTPYEKVLKDYKIKRDDPLLIEAILGGNLHQYWIYTTQFLKSNDPIDICRVSGGCDWSTLCFMFRTVPEKAGEILEIKKRNGLCHSAMELGEKMVNKGLQNGIT